jgi:hypothetical protein
MRTGCPGLGVLVVAVLAAACSSGHAAPGKNPSSTSQEPAAVGEIDGGLPAGMGSGPGVNAGATPTGCAQDDALDCPQGVGITCWGLVFPDPGEWSCSNAVLEGATAYYYGYCCD